jgi:NAD-dependent DNA ligase
MNLKDLLEQADARYYSGEGSPLTDREYDQLALAVGHKAEISDPDMKSLNNAIDEDEFLDWVDTVPSRDRFFYVELKCDGVSAILDYSATTLRTRRMTLDLGLVPPITTQQVVRGEIWHSNGRAYAAGRVRANDATAGLQFMPFCNSPAERLLYPSEIVSPWHIATDKLADIIDAWEAWRDGRLCPSFPSDGIVVKCALGDTRRRLGTGKRAPRWAIALK